MGVDDRLPVVAFVVEAGPADGAREGAGGRVGESVVGVGGVGGLGVEVDGGDLGDGVVAEEEVRVDDGVAGVGRLEDAELGAAGSALGVHAGGVGHGAGGDALHVDGDVGVGVRVVVCGEGVGAVGGGEDAVGAAGREGGDGTFRHDADGGVVRVLVFEAVSVDGVIRVGVDCLWGGLVVKVCGLNHWVIGRDDAVCIGCG